MPTSVGAVQLFRRSWSRPIDVFGRPDAHRLELALLPRSRAARACFPDRWGPDRFEPVGELFLLPAGQRVHARSVCRDQSSIVCTLEPDVVQGWTDGGMEWTDHRLHAGLDIANPVIRGLVRQLGAEVHRPGFATEALAELVVGQIAIELVRHCFGIEERPVTAGLAPWRLRLIDERLDEPGAWPSLGELAGLCGLSVRHLSRAFRVSHGRAIGGYLGERRLDRARRLLALGHGIKSVAHMVGFGSASSFSVAFRRGTGGSPGDYRRRASRSVGSTNAGSRCA